MEPPVKKILGLLLSLGLLAGSLAAKKAESKPERAAEKQAAQGEDRGGHGRPDQAKSDDHQGRQGQDSGAAEIDKVLVVAAGGCKLYHGASLESKVEADLKAGQQFVVRGQENGFFKIAFAGHSSFIPAACLQDAPAATAGYKSVQVAR
jgi:hypothetical protein